MIIQFILIPLLLINGIDYSGSFLPFFLLITATVLIAAGGYVLNDYFDLKIDAYNKPEKQVIGRFISKQKAMLTYQALTVSGIISGITLSWLLKDFTLALIFIAIPGLLWFYSASYKRQFITGNIIVAFVAGLTIFIVGMTEMAILHIKFGRLIFETGVPEQIYGWTGGFALFAFLLTLIREIIKDMEDVYGDRELECRTMPVVWGNLNSKVVVWTLIFITIILLLGSYVLFIPFEGSLITLRYIIFGIILPLLALSYLILKAKHPKDYHQASSLSKFIMFIGLLYTLIFNYQLAKATGISIFNTFL
jgi:4-hydroxybenzoate polyprenyltransferase